LDLHLYEGLLGLSACLLLFQLEIHILAISQEPVHINTYLDYPFKCPEILSTGKIASFSQLRSDLQANELPSKVKTWPQNITNVNLRFISIAVQNWLLELLFFFLLRFCLQMPIDLIKFEFLHNADVEFGEEVVNFGFVKGHVIIAAELGAYVV
jgi:hypothetical protein